MVSGYLLHEQMLPTVCTSPIVTLHETGLNSLLLHLPWWLTVHIFRVLLAPEIIPTKLAIVQFTLQIMESIDIVSFDE